MLREFKRVTLATASELPFGRGHRWGDGWNGVLYMRYSARWQLSAKYE